MQIWYKQSSTDFIIVLYTSNNTQQNKFVHFEHNTYIKFIRCVKNFV